MDPQIQIVGYCVVYPAVGDDAMLCCCSRVEIMFFAF